MSISIEEKVLMGKDIAETFLAELCEDGATPLDAMFIATVALAHLTNLSWASAPMEMKKHVTEALTMSIVTLIDTAKANGVKTDLIAPEMPEMDGIIRKVHIVDNNGIHNVN